MATRIMINIEVPSSLRRKYKRACKKLSVDGYKMKMRDPILKAINDTIKLAKGKS